MIFKETKLKNVFIIEIEKREDDRGFFARTFCEKEFKSHGLVTTIDQCNKSFNFKAGTVRGLHYQTAPAEETKIIQCIKGKIYDVIVDIRKNSETYGQWFGVELDENNHTMLYCPEGCAHGFQALVDNTAIMYQVSKSYSPDNEKGVRWNDPTFGIKWPITDSVIISQKDQTYPDFEL